MLYSIINLVCTIWLWPASLFGDTEHDFVVLKYHELKLKYFMSFIWEINAEVCCFQDLDDRELRELAALTLEADGDELDYRDDGYIELVLKILGLMCDGQNRVLQVRASEWYGLKIVIQVNGIVWYIIILQHGSFN